ncbi:DUF4158 domain-containing protein [Microvirga makkahensis]|uniref:DUF4158 domain-containing protein n=1 Tax=Microvirga makkahensis TaxID=1128670 RepID=A0A7X3MWM1_9HYPH|nr:DUF4158 domain-containing protein [Microvirga makkahensis]
MARRKLLTPDERQALLGIPDDEESLIRHYTLSPRDRLQAEVRRRPHNQLGYAVQLCIMRYPGRVLGMGEDPRLCRGSWLKLKEGKECRSASGGEPLELLGEREM